MECHCGLPVRQSVYRDGRACYTCPHGGCRFFGFSPVQCEGYHRILATSRMAPETTIVTFEALLHPDTQAPAVMATLWTLNEVAGRATSEAARVVLERDVFEPAFYVAKRAYLYPMAQYEHVTAALRTVAHVLVQEVPSFFLRSWGQTRRLPELFAEAVAAGREAAVDPSDLVYSQLKSFQKKGVDFIVSHGGRGMIADDMGLGKTVQAIATAHHYRSEWPVLVVCPMSLVENWAKEFHRFCGIPFSRIAILQGTKAQPEPIHDIVIVSYSSLKCVEKGSYQVIILDESHYIKAGDSKRTQLALRLCHAARRVVLLSGTPAMSRPMELYTQLSAVHPHMMPTKTQYAARYCNGHVGRFGMDYHGHSHISELHFLLEHFIIRRTKRDLAAAELPSKTRQLLYIYITAREKKALEKQVVALRKSILERAPSASSGGGPAGANGGLGGDLSSRAPNAFELKIATARAKIPAVRDYVASVVEQHLESGEKILFFAHHQCMMEAIKSAVEEVRPSHPIDYIYITGETPAAQREQLATHFRQEPTCAVAVLSMGSSGTGHNFTCASTVVFAELDWNPSTHLQCEDRVHRIGQANPCTIKYLLADGTSDDVIWPMLQAKLTVTSAVLERSTAQRLADNAAQQRISRRDVPAADGTAAQATLEVFITGSGSCQGGPSGSASSSGALATGKNMTTDAEVVPIADGTPSRPEPLHLGTIPPPLPPRVASGTETLPTPPATQDETQPPVTSAAAAAVVSSCAPLVISVEELRRSPHLLTPAHATPRAGTGGSHARSTAGNKSLGPVGGGSPSATRVSQGGGGAPSQHHSQPSPTASGNVLDMMRRSQQQAAPTAADVDDVVVVERGGAVCEPSVTAATRPPPTAGPAHVTVAAAIAHLPQQGIRTPPRRTLVSTSADRAVVGAGSPAPTPIVGAAAMSAAGSTGSPPIPLPARRTTFRLQPTTSAVATPPPTPHVTTPAPAAGPVPVPAAAGMTPLVRVPVRVDLRKRRRSPIRCAAPAPPPPPPPPPPPAPQPSVGNGAGPGSVVEGPTYTPRPSTVGPAIVAAVPLATSVGEAPKPPGRRTTFCFRTTSAPESRGAAG